MRAASTCSRCTDVENMGLCLSAKAASLSDFTFTSLSCLFCEFRLRVQRAAEDHQTPPDPPSAAYAHARCPPSLRVCDLKWMEVNEALFSFSPGTDETVEEGPQMVRVESLMKTAISVHAKPAADAGHWSLTESGHWTRLMVMSVNTWTQSQEIKLQQTWKLCKESGRNMSEWRSFRYNSTTICFSTSFRLWGWSGAAFRFTLSLFKTRGSTDSFHAAQSCSSQFSLSPVKVNTFIAVSVHRTLSLLRVSLSVETLEGERTGVVTLFFNGRNLWFTLSDCAHRLTPCVLPLD